MCCLFCCSYPRRTNGRGSRQLFKAFILYEFLYEFFQFSEAFCVAFAFRFSFSPIRPLVIFAFLHLPCVFVRLLLRCLSIGT